MLYPTIFGLVPALIFINTREWSNSLTLLLADTDSATSPTSRLGVLASDSQTPVVS